MNRPLMAMLAAAALGFSLIGTCGAVEATADAASRKLASPILVSGRCELGVVRPWQWGECELTLTNKSANSWRVGLLADSASRGIKLLGAPVTLAPHQSTAVNVGRLLGVPLGVRQAGDSLIATSDDGMTVKVPFSGQGFVYSGLDAQPEVKLGSVDASNRTPHDVRIVSADDPHFALTRIISIPQFVTAKLINAHSISISIAPQANWGYLFGYVRIRTNSSIEPEVRVAISATIHGRVLPNINPFSLGLLRTNRDNEILIRLTDPGHAPVQIGNVKLHNLKARVTTADCVPAKSGCKDLEVRISKDQPTGSLASRIEVGLPAYRRTLTIGVFGLLLGPGVKVHDFDLTKNSAGVSAGGKTGPDLNFSAALAKAIEPKDPVPAAPPGKGPLLRWTTEHDGKVYGYLVYRSTSKDGPFRRVNAKILPATNGGSQTHHYVWRDTTATAGKTYWYYISTLANNGKRAKLSQPAQVRAK